MRNVLASILLVLLVPFSAGARARSLDTLEAVRSACEESAVSGPRTKASTCGPLSAARSRLVRMISAGSIQYVPAGVVLPAPPASTASMSPSRPLAPKRRRCGVTAASPRMARTRSM